MKKISYLEKAEDLVLYGSSVEELILGHEGLSRFGKLSTNELHSLAGKCRDSGIRPVLEWDILMTQNDFSHCRKILEEIDLNLFGAIRVQDPGALQWVMEHNPHRKIQLILESGNHNIKGLQGWCQYVGAALERIVLSSEIPKAKLEEYIKELPVPVEILGWGKILLFYSPRGLLSPLIPSHARAGGEIEAAASSEETPHKGFFVLENRHGTFMFYPKELCLLEKAGELEEMGVGGLRLDFRFASTLVSAQEILEGKIPQGAFRGFYQTNKTDAIFPRLKNKFLWRDEEKENLFLGEIIEVVKGRHAALMLKNGNQALRSGISLQASTPEGKVIQFTSGEIRDSHGRTLEEAFGEKLVFLSYAKGLGVGSLIYLDNPGFIKID